MQTVVETSAYISAAAAAGMTAEEMRRAVDAVAENPEAGDVMVGTGGCRKLRLAGKGKGKGGGYRVITYFGARSRPVFLLTVFAKNERANLTKGERNELQALTKALG